MASDETLRALLGEARAWIDGEITGQTAYDMVRRIDAALSSPLPPPREVEAIRLTGSVAVGNSLANLAERECENGIEAIGETCSATSRAPDNVGEDDYRFQHWCGPCIASALLAEGIDAALASPPPDGTQWSLQQDVRLAQAEIDGARAHNRRREDGEHHLVVAVDALARIAAALRAQPIPPPASPKDGGGPAAERFCPVGCGAHEDPGPWHQRGCARWRETIPAAGHNEPDGGKP